MEIITANPQIKIQSANLRFFHFLGVSLRAVGLQPLAAPGRAFGYISTLCCEDTASIPNANLLTYDFSLSTFD